MKNHPKLDSVAAWQLKISAQPDVFERCGAAFAAMRMNIGASWQSRLGFLLYAVRPNQRRSDWLSAHVKTKNEIKRDRLKISGDRRGLHEFGHRFHTTQRVFALAGIVLLSLVGTSAAIGFGIHFFACECVEDYSDLLLTLAEFVGTVCGILIGVICFAVQFHSDRLDRAAFLLRYFNRREGILPICGLTGAIILADLIMGLISKIWFSEMAFPLLVMNIVLAPLIILLSFVLLCRAIENVTRNLYQVSVQPGLIWEYHDFLDDELFYGAMQAALESSLRDYSAELNYWAGYAMGSDETTLKAKAPTSGDVVDVNLATLRDVLSGIRRLSPECKIRFCAVPGLRVEQSAVLSVALVSSDETDIRGRISRTMQPMSRAIRLRSQIGYEIPEVFRQLSNTIVSHAKAGSSAELEECVQLLFVMIETRVKRTDLSLIATRNLFQFGEHLSEFDYFHIAKAAIKSGDEDIVQAVFGFAHNTIDLGLRSQRYDVFAVGTQVIRTLYETATATGEMADRLTSQLDHLLHTSILTLKYAPIEKDSQPWDEKELRGFQLRLAGWIASLTRLAIDAQRVQNAMDFIDQLEKLSEVQGSRRHDADPLEKVANYVKILLLGWLFEGRAKRTFGTAERDIAARLVKGFHAKYQVLEAWESFINPEEGGGVISVEDWDSLNRRHRSGFAYSRGESTWPMAGLLVAMLRAPGEFTLPNYGILTSTPTEAPLGSTQLKALTDELKKQASKYGDSLAIDSEQLETSLKLAIGMFAKRQHLFRLHELKSIIDTPIAATLGDEIADEITAKVQHCAWLPSTTEFGGREPIMMPVYPPRIQRLVPKRIFSRDVARGNTWTDHWAERLCHHEAVELSYLSESLVKPTASCNELSELPSLLRRAIKQLTKQGRKPSLIFLPREVRFVKAVFGVSDWDIDTHISGERDHVGVWEGINVWYFPYTNSVSAMVIDSSRFFGAQSASTGKTVEVFIEDLSSEEKASILEAHRLPSDEAILPDTGSINIRFRAELQPVYGIFDLQSAARIDIRVDRLGYAISKHDNYFHRPTCVHYDRTDAEFNLAGHLSIENERRSPCPHCQPGDWGSEEELPEADIQPDDVISPKTGKPLDG